jgi:CobQ-like glutamine amidotransferase family enzyme
MLYIGCGTERASIRALEALADSRHVIEEYYHSGAIILATGNSFDLFGKEIVDDRDGTYPGLGLFDYTVKRTHKKRFLGDAVLSCYAFFGKVIGFVNKCSTVSGVETPLFRAEMGYGNDNESSDEGLFSGGFIGTSLIGPVLVRNPIFCAYIMERLYEKAHFAPSSEADMTLQKEAYTVSLRELSERIK